MKIVSRERKRKGLRISSLALLLVVFKWHHGGERVKSLLPSGVWNQRSEELHTKGGKSAWAAPTPQSAAGSGGHGRHTRPAGPHLPHATPHWPGRNRLYRRLWCHRQTGAAVPGKGGSSLQHTCRQVTYVSMRRSLMSPPDGCCCTREGGIFSPTYLFSSYLCISEGVFESQIHNNKDWHPHWYVTSKIDILTAVQS